MLMSRLDERTGPKPAPMIHHVSKLRLPAFDTGKELTIILQAGQCPAVSVMSLLHVSRFSRDEACNWLPLLRVQYRCSVLAMAAA